MGYYTKLQCNLVLKKDENLYEILQNMLNEKDTLDLSKIEHDFFKTERYNVMLKCCSYYFTGTNNSNLLDNTYNYVLHIDCDLKDYDDEIKLFLDWISQYLDYTSTEFVGYYRYELTKNPTLLYVENNKIKKYDIISLEEVK